MKKINYKKVLGAFLWLLAITGIGISLAFAVKSADLVRAGRVDVLIENDENFFLNEEGVREFFSDRKVPIIGCLVKDINIPMLEKSLNAHPAVEKAEVAASLDGAVKVRVLQRSPVLRVINKSGESYYVDSGSRLMPLNENYSARVLVASGEIYEPFARRSLLSVDQIAQNQTYSEISVLDDLYTVAKRIAADKKLSALIHQMYVNKDQEIELYPAAGDHRIVLGDARDLDVKFNKLRLFYTEGLNATNGWNKYASIDLRYKNLVVCTKK